jgi:hypothetical protein
MMASPGPAPNAPMPQSPMSVEHGLNGNGNAVGSPESQRTGRTQGSWNTTPRGRRSQSQLSFNRGSVGKRSGTPAAEYLRWTEHDSPYSPGKSFEHVAGGDEDDDLDFELNDDSRSDGGFEGLENVRACCDGRHTVGRAGTHHHHHHHHHQQQQSDRLDPGVAEAARPKSPSGWSMRSARSRAGSTNSRDGRSLFSRFGTKRSTKTVAVPAGSDR